MLQNRCRVSGRANFIGTEIVVVRTAMNGKSTKETEREIKAAIYRLRADLPPLPESSR